MAFIRRHWRNEAERADIRQDVYERALVGAGRDLPRHPRSYLLTIARNAMIDRARKARIVSFELVADLDLVTVEPDMLTPERWVDGRQRLRRLMDGVDRLPPRCREVVRLRKVEGLTTRETAERLAVGIDAVEQQLTLGMRALVDFMRGGTGKPVRRPRKARPQSERQS